MALETVAIKYPQLFKLPVYAGVTIKCSKVLEKPLRNLLTWRQEAIDATEELEEAVEGTEFAGAYELLMAHDYDLERLLLIVNGKQWIDVGGRLFEALRAPTKAELPAILEQEIVAEERSEKKRKRDLAAKKIADQLAFEESLTALTNVDASVLPEALGKVADELESYFFSGFDRKLALQRILSASQRASSAGFSEFLEGLPKMPIAEVVENLRGFAHRQRNLSEKN